MSAASRVLLVGWDAADWEQLGPLLDRGLLPSLKSLIDRGVYGKLASCRPMLSPMLWTSIATGKRPAKHGIRGFTEVADGQTVRPVASTSRRCRAIWNMLTLEERRSLVVGWYASHPAEPIRGAIISDQCDHSDEGVHPPELAAEIAELRVRPEELAADAFAQFVPSLGRTRDWSTIPRLNKLAALIAQTATIHARATHLMATQPWDFAAIYYEGIDRFAHEFMPFAAPKHPAVSVADFERFGSTMTCCYAFHDMMLGALLDLAGPETTVLLVSDHGYAGGDHRPLDLEADPTRWHRPFGVAVAAGPGIRQGAKLHGASILDVTPTVLHLFGLPVGRDMDGRPWAEVVDSASVVRRIDSWDTLPGNAGTLEIETAVDPLAAAAALRQLESLGYIAPVADTDAVEQTIAGNESRLAESLIDAHDYVAAETLLDDLCRRYPSELSLHAKLAGCQIANGKLSEGRSLSTSLAEHAAARPAALLLLAGIDLAEDKPQESLAKLREVERLAPATPELPVRLGLLLLQLDQFADAESAFRRALEVDASSLALDGLSQIAFNRRDFASAVDFALEAIDITYFLPKAHVHLGQALAALRRDEEAIAAFRVALNLMPGLKGAHAGLAEVFERRGDASAAARQRAKLAGAWLDSAG